MGPNSPQFWSRRRVFVIGCTGVLGTQVVRELLAAGAEVVGLVRARVPDSDLLREGLFERVAIVRGRVEDRGRLETAFALHEIQTVFHLTVPGVEIVLDAALRALPDGAVVLPLPSASAAAFARRTGYRVGLAELPALSDERSVTHAARALLTLAEAVAADPMAWSGWPVRLDSMTAGYELSAA